MTTAPKSLYSKHPVAVMSAAALTLVGTYYIFNANKLRPDKQIPARFVTGASIGSPLPPTSHLFKQPVRPRQEECHHPYHRHTQDCRR